jgi:apolipoprotein N-acyltransferase
MRAAENRRWILRATNNGITAMIDPAGRVTERLPEHQMAASDLRFNYVSELTPYARFGDWFAWSCIVGGIVAIFLETLMKPRQAGVGVPSG